MSLRWSLELTLVTKAAVGDVLALDNRTQQLVEEKGHVGVHNFGADCAHFDVLVTCIQKETCIY